MVQTLILWSAILLLTRSVGRDLRALLARPDDPASDSPEAGKRAHGDAQAPPTADRTGTIRRDATWIAASTPPAPGARPASSSSTGTSGAARSSSLTTSASSGAAPRRTISTFTTSRRPTRTRSTPTTSTPSAAATTRRGIGYSGERRHRG